MQHQDDCTRYWYYTTKINGADAWYIKGTGGVLRFKIGIAPLSAIIFHKSIVYIRFRCVLRNIITSGCQFFNVATPKKRDPFRIAVLNTRPNEKKTPSSTRTRTEMLTTIRQRTQDYHSYQYLAALVLVPINSYSYAIFSLASSFDCVSGLACNTSQIRLVSEMYSSSTTARKTPKKKYQ